MHPGVDGSSATVFLRPVETHSSILIRVKISPQFEASIEDNAVPVLGVREDKFHGLQLAVEVFLGLARHAADLCPAVKDKPRCRPSAVRRVNRPV